MLQSMLAVKTASSHLHDLSSSCQKKSTTFWALPPQQIVQPFYLPGFHQSVLLLIFLLDSASAICKSLSLLSVFGLCIVLPLAHLLATHLTAKTISLSVLRMSSASFKTSECRNSHTSARCNDWRLTHKRCLAWFKNSHFVVTKTSANSPQMKAGFYFC